MQVCPKVSCWEWLRVSAFSIIKFLLKTGHSVRTRQQICILNLQEIRKHNRPLSVLVKIQGCSTLLLRLCLTACGILVPNQGLNPCPGQWKPQVLTTGLPANSLCLCCEGLSSTLKDIQQCLCPYPLDARSIPGLWQPKIHRRWKISPSWQKSLPMPKLEDHLQFFRMPRIPSHPAVRQIAHH